MPIIDMKSETRAPEAENAEPHDAPAPSAERVWDALLDCASLRRSGCLQGAHALGYAGTDGLGTVVAGSPRAWFHRNSSGAWTAASSLRGEALALADLYLGICTAPTGRAYVTGHLGQSLDGYIATHNGDSDYVTGPENIVHLHRMRALCDAVVVGAGTVASDDPELTVRLAPGRNPARIVIDPSQRLTGAYKVFSDDKAPTWLVCAEHVAAAARAPGNAGIIGVPVRDGRLELAALVDRLGDRGLETLFIEGGGETVSSFFDAGLLDRLQIAVAFLLTGRGRPGLRTRARDSLADCLRPPGRLYRMGNDMLFDCDLRASGGHNQHEAEGRPALERIF